MKKRLTDAERKTIADGKCPQCGGALVTANPHWVQCEHRRATLSNPTSVGSCNFHCGSHLIRGAA